MGGCNEAIRANNDFVDQMKSFMIKIPRHKYITMIGSVLKLCTQARLRMATNHPMIHHSFVFGYSI